MRRRFLLLIASSTALFVAASVPLSRWVTLSPGSTFKGVELNVSSCADDSAMTIALLAGSAAFFLLLGAISRRLGLGVGLVAVAVAALCYGLAVWVQELVFPDAGCRVVLFGMLAGYMAREPVVSAVVIALSAAVALAIASIGSFGLDLWRRLRVSAPSER